MNYSVFIKSLKYIFLFFSIMILILVVYNNKPVKKEKVYNDFSYDESDFQSFKQVDYGTPPDMRVQSFED